MYATSLMRCKYVNFYNNGQFSPVVIQRLFNNVVLFCRLIVSSQIHARRGSAICVTLVICLLNIIVRLHFPISPST